MVDWSCKNLLWINQSFLLPSLFTPFNQPIHSVTLIIFYNQSINQYFLVPLLFSPANQSINQSILLPSLFLQRINKSILSPSLFPLPNKPSILLPSLFPPPNQSINQSTNTFLIFHQPINQFIMLSVSSSLNYQNSPGRRNHCIPTEDNVISRTAFYYVHDDGDKESIQIVLLHL